ncbi:hypothetical protein BDY24DRAFT_105550 [Mrakia frigida]|uniref:uncharacterized protein n=1 Tax=Mrakia frigida TaxID=29902 RepID=UPI003FCBF6B7
MVLPTLTFTSTLPSLFLFLQQNTHPFVSSHRSSTLLHLSLSTGLPLFTMILKEDITVFQTTRLPSPTLRGVPSTSPSEESVPWYRPPSMPPQARVNGADPAPWRVDPPPR